jgi:integrase/recombinase XerD
MDNLLTRQQLPVPQVTVDVAFDGWLAGQLAESTRRLYRRDLEDFFDGIPTAEKILALTDADLQIWRNKTLKKGPDDQNYLEASTICRKLASLSSFYGYLQAKGLISVNPASPKLVRRPKLSEWTPQLGLMPTEMQQVIVACHRPTGSRNVQESMARDLALITLLYTALLRRSEAANANWGDISKQAEHYWLNIPIAKGGHNQKVKLEPVVIGLLNRYIEEMGGQKAFEKKSNLPFDRCPIFVALDRAHFFHRLTDHSINQIVKKRSETAQLPQGTSVTAHTMRHTGITHMLLAGKNPLAVQKLARHKDLSTTMIYAALAQQLAESPSYVLAGHVEDVLTEIEAQNELF